MNATRRTGLAVIVVCLAGLCGVGRAADAPPQPALYAVYAWPADVITYADDIVGVGFQWIRAGGWGRDQQVNDRMMVVAAQRGLHPVPVLEVGGMGHGQTRPIEEAEADMTEYARRNVLRYGPGGSFWKEHPELTASPIRHWEIWNEPNIEFLTPPDESIPRTDVYARLLTAASREIRRLDPGATIIAFNTSGGVADHGQALKADGMFERLKYIGWRKFIRDTAAQVDPSTYDAIGTHPYTRPDAPEAGILGGLEMVDQLGLNKPVWFTEVGYPLEYPRNQQVRDDDQQAAYLVRLFAIAGAHEVVQVQVMYLVDIIYREDGSRRSFGLFPAPGQWRKQATATEVMIDLIPDPRRDVRILSQMPGGLFAYRFAGPEGVPIVMAWNASDTPGQASFALEGEQFCRVDMLGGVEPLDAADGVVTVAIGEAPVYIVPRPADTVAAWIRQR
ncbi:MAG: hypothetical protein GX591_07885 [Planctomycetes bacterium]|nr:hypothetical protein [Planctomycetota bacterium]